MPALTQREHALLFRTLVKECGGFDEAATACRLSRSRLYEVADPQSIDCSPIDVIADLEAYCGRAIYSQALASRRPTSAEPVGGVVAEACDVSEAAADLQKLIRLAAADGELSAREKTEAINAALHLYDQVKQFCVAAERGRI